MALVSGKALWSVICGQCVLASDEVVGEELENAASHLKEGILFYKTWSEEGHKTWCNKSKLKKEQQEFVSKIGKMLEICSEQAWEVFQLFLQYEFRGSVTQLQSASTCEREELNLLHQVFFFFLSDPLHLLSCLRHILAADASHPYDKLFKEFIHKLLDPDSTLGRKLVTQLQKMNMKVSRSPSTSLHLPLKASQARISYQLSAIRHQLVTLLVYYGSPENPCPPEAILTLLQLAQGVGLGRDLFEGVGINDKNTFGSQLDAIDVFHSFLLALAINADSDPKTNLLCKPEWVSRLNPLIHTLGSKPWHYPPILAWAILQGRRVAGDADASSEEASKYSRLVQRAIKGNVFRYLQNALKIPAFETDHLLLVIGSSITYSLICIVGTSLDLDKIGLIQEAQELAKVCLAFEPPAHFFWNEGGGGASVLLPNALELFPHSPSALLDMTTSLASANEFSAGKVVQLMKELETFTWPLTASDASVVSVSGNQCVSRANIFPLPEFVIPKDSHGLILNLQALASDPSTPLLICWQIPSNAWQVILSSFKLLRNMIASGGVADEWSLRLVVGGLKAVSAVFRSDPQQQQSVVFQELQIVAQMLFVSVSQILKPDYTLTSALLEFFSGISKANLSSLWNDLDGCPLLPYLPATKTGRTSSTDLLVNYRAGNIRALICGVEANSGKFSVLKHLCLLSESALKNGLRPNSVRGTIIFIVKEVVPSMLLWRCSDISQRIDMVESTFSLLHHTLEDGSIDSALQSLVVSELSNARGGAGTSLKNVLESSANLQATLDQPAEWPHSSHARKLTKMAKLALSLAHRLVSQYLTSGDSLRHFFLEGSPPNSLQGPINRFPGVWVTTRPPHLALTIAQFVHHRINPRLPYLALRTLTRLAKEIAVPLVACLGTEAEGLRDCLLNRLDSATEDLLVKVALLRLLTLSTIHQPGLIRLFLTPPQPLLDSVISLLQIHKMNKTEAETELVLSLVELVASLFEKNLVAATTYLRSKSEFWDGISYCLCNNNPGEVCDSIIGNIFKVFSLECYGSNDEKLCENFKKTSGTFFNPDSNKFPSWTKYIFVTYVEKTLNSMESDATEKQRSDDPKSELLASCSHFFVVILSKFPASMKDEQKSLLALCVIESLLNLFESENDNCHSLQILLSDIHLSLLSRCGKLMVENKDYVSYLVRLLSLLQSSVMQTSVQCQVLILSATLKALTSVITNTRELGSLLVTPSMLLAEQHCSLSTSGVDTESTGFTSPTCLALACALLYQCLEPLENSKIESHIESSNLIPALLEAAVRHTQFGNSSVVREIQRLLTLIVRRTGNTTELSTNSLAESVSLVLASKHKLDHSILRDLLWCTTFCLKKEGGAEGLEGAVSLIAVHLSSLTAALACPDTHADLALATASLVATLAPFHQLWRVIHPDCFEQMVLATAGCIHFTTKMLHLKESLEREVCGDKRDASNATSGLSLPGLSQPTIGLINQLLQILGMCLETIRYLSPDLVDLFCFHGDEINSGNFDLIQPSIRRHSGNQGTLPNLATLADILDLYHTLIPKEGRSSGSLQRSVHFTAKVDLSYLTRCTEESLYLLLIYSAIFIFDPAVQAREARDVRTFLADETSSFFSHWLGRRSVSTSSPLLSPKSPLSDLPYFMLCRQLVTSICNSKK